MTQLTQVQERLSANVLSSEDSNMLKGGCRRRRGGGCGDGRRRGRRGRGRWGGCSSGTTSTPTPPTTVTEPDDTRIGTTFDLG